MINEDRERLERLVEDIEILVNKRIAEIAEEFGLDGARTALVNLGTGFSAKALVVTPRDLRDHLLLTIQSLIDSRTEEGDAAIESAVAITRAMGSTCRPH